MAPHPKVRRWTRSPPFCSTRPRSTTTPFCATAPRPTKTRSPNWRPIATTGLRQPIEVWTRSPPSDPHRYGLISSLRRLTAHRRLGLPTIPAFLRTPASIPAAMAAMIAENDLRTDPAPWERGMTLAATVTHCLLPTLDDALTALHPTATRQKRTRLRNLALVAEDFDGTLATPHLLTTAQIDRLATDLRTGLGAILHQILPEHPRASLPTQWTALLPTLCEPLETAPPDRPRRPLHLKQGLTIRREKCREGWLLRFTGPEAKTGGLVDDVLDKVEFWFGR